MGIRVQPLIQHGYAPAAVPNERRRVGLQFTTAVTN